MKTRSSYQLALYACLFLMGATVTDLSAQSKNISIGTDFFSRYIWRGFDYGNSTSIQPSFAYSSSGFEAGFWGAYGTNSNFAEIDLYAGYTLSSKSGDFYIGMTDYYYPDAAVKYMEFENNHVYEANFTYSGTESFPISLGAHMNLFGADKQNSIYFEASYPISVVTLTVGGLPQKSDYYGISKAGLVNVGIASEKSIQLTETFSLPISGQVILNPYTESIFFLVGFSL